MIQVPQHARTEEVLVSEHICQRVDGAARDTCDPELLSPLVRGTLAELFLQLRDQSLSVGHAVRVCGEPFVLDQLGTAYYFAQVGELGVVADGHDKGFVRGIEGLVWNDGGMGVTYK